CSPEVEAVVPAQAVDDLTNVLQEEFGYRLRRLNMLLRLALGEMTSHLQIEAERGQMMTQQIMQFAGDPHALRHLAAVHKQLLSCTQLGIPFRQLISGFGFPCDGLGQEHGKSLNAEPRGRKAERDFEGEVGTNDDAHQEGLRGYPAQRNRQREQGSELT